MYFILCKVTIYHKGQGIRLPKEILKSAGIALNEVLDITVSNGVITLAKLFHHKTLEERAAEFECLMANMIGTGLSEERCGNGTFASRRYSENRENQTPSTTLSRGRSIYGCLQKIQKGIYIAKSSHCWIYQYLMFFCEANVDVCCLKLRVLAKISNRKKDYEDLKAHKPAFTGYIQEWA